MAAGKGAALAIQNRCKTVELAEDDTVSGFFGNTKFEKYYNTALHPII